MATIRSLDRLWGNKVSQKVREMSSSELRECIAKALREEAQPAAGGSGLDVPAGGGLVSQGYVSEVFPHKQCFVYSQGGKNWMRSYSFDGEGCVKLKNDRKETRQRWVQAAAQEGTVDQALRRSGL